MKYQFFPRSQGVADEILKVIAVFAQEFEKIDSKKFNLVSDDVLAVLRQGLESIGFSVEGGKRNGEKIKVPVLFGINNKIDREFNADAVSSDGKIVIEIEAGRAVDNNQYLKDIFQASLMHEVEYLILAVRNLYRGKNDFDKVYSFLETLYISNRIKLPLKGILLIGY